MVEPSRRPAEQIRHHLARVTELRQHAHRSGHQAAVLAVKRLQATRFRTTYGDLLAHRSSAPAVRFFLEELYGEHDFSQRDEQFGRIAGALERMFPPAVNQLAVDLTEMHALTESLDHLMAMHWETLPDGLSAAERYVMAWRQCGNREDRARQLAVVQHMGGELQRLTRMKPLRLALRMMRQPARAAGLDALQGFLESGFDAFSTLGDSSEFLATIHAREAAWIDALFDMDLRSCAQRLQSELDSGR